MRLCEPPPRLRCRTLPTYHLRTGSAQNVCPLEDVGSQAGAREYKWPWIQLDQRAAPQELEGSVHTRMATFEVIRRYA